MPDYFEDVGSLAIVESHIEQVQKLEETQSKAMLKRYKEIRLELNDRLLSSKSNSFTQQQLRGTLVQVDSAIDAMNRSLKGEIGTQAKKASLLGVNHLLKEISAFEKEFGGTITPINLNAGLIANDASKFKINTAQSSLDAYSEDLRSSITTELSNAALIGMDYSKVSQNLGQFFKGEEWKLERIARTEMHGIYNLGKQKGMEEVQDEYIDDLKKALIHPMDNRTGKDSKYAASKEMVVDIDKPFSYTWGGKLRVFMVPPDRPNDRAIMVPYRPSW